VAHLPRLFLIVTALLIFSLLGCVSPIASDRRAIGIGLFTAQHDAPSAGVLYGRLEGFGLAIGRGQLAIGFVRWQWVHWQEPDQPRRYLTPLGVFVIVPHPSH